MNTISGTFFQPFINGFNQFTTRLNPFAPQQQQQTRPPGPQQFQNFNAVPVQSQQQTPQQSTGAQFPPPGQNLRQNFQTIRFPSGQVVSQNQQFGVISNTNPSVQPQFPGFNSQQFNSQPQAPPQQPPQQQAPFAGFDSQFSQSPQQRFPPSQDSGLSSGFVVNTPQGIQSSSALSQSFRPLANQGQSQPSPPRQLDDQQIAQTTDQALDFSRAPEQFRSTTFSPQFDNGIQQDLINGARVRLRPLSTTVGSVGSSETQAPRRPVSRVRSRPTTPTPAARAPARVPVRELPPRTPTASRERRPTNDVISSSPSPPRLNTIQEFIRGSSNESPTPPPIISRVRGRPIVPEDFPGPSQAVRGATPDDEEEEEQKAAPSRGAFSNPRGRGSSASGSGRGPTSSGKRNRVRIVPTGNRARQPVNRVPVNEKKKDVNDFKERPRATGNTRVRPQSNRLPFTATDLDDKEEVDASDLPDNNSGRRLRPATRFSSSSPPRRKLRPFTTEDPPRESTSKNLISLIPTVPSRNRDSGKSIVDKTIKPKPVQSTTSIANLLSTDDFDLAAVVEALRANSREQFDLDILNAQVKAVEHEEQLELTGGRGPKFSSPPNSIPLDDDNEESNIIPFSDVPSDDGVNNDPEELDGSAITVINLQKDRAKQNFKGFIDTDLIDDSLRKSTSRPPFVPTISPQFRLTTTKRTTTTTTPKSTSPFVKTTTTSRPPSSSSVRFLPTSLPPIRDENKFTTRASTTTRRSTSTSSFSTTTKEQEKEKEAKVSVSVSTSLSSTSSSSSSSSSSQASIQDQLDKLQSALDPWAIINNNDKSTPSTTTESTTRLSLFKIRTLPTKRTTTTTTFKPRSLADLFKLRNGQKLTNEDKEDIETEKPRLSPLLKNNSGSKDKDNNIFGQSAVEKLKSRLEKFRPKAKKIPTTTTTTTTTTTSTTTTTTTQKSTTSRKHQKKRPKTVKDILGIMI